MKNIITLLFILFGVTIYAQDLSIRIDAAKYRHVTTAVRDTYVVPAGQTWRIFNTTTGTWQSNNAGAGWVDDAGAGGGIGSLLEDTSPQLGGNLETNGSNITVNGDQINNALLISSESVQINGDGVGAGLTGWQIDSEGSTFNSSARINFKNELSGGGYQSEYSLAWGGVPTQSADLVPLGYAQANFAPITAGVTDGDKGDITVSGSGAVWDIDVDAVDATHIQTDAVGINEIANNSVNTGEIVDGAVSSTDIADGTILEQDLSTTNGQVSGWILTSNGTTQFTWADPNVLAGTTSWGLITGTLSSQTDLQNALDDRITKTANTIGISDFSIIATGTPPNGIFIDGQNGTTELTGGTTAANEVEQMLFGDLWTVDFKVNGAGVDYSLNSTGTPTNGTDLITKTYADTNYNAAGDVTKVGTPVDDQIGIWTGDGTIEGNSSLTFTGGNLIAANNIVAAAVQSNNPNNASANFQLQWSSDVPRIRIGGSGTGTTNGFEIRKSGDVLLLGLSNDGDATLGRNLLLDGSTSGTATITAPAVAGTPTLTLPITSGTFALTSDIIDPSGTYLPLGGGAMTGSITSGVSGSFSVGSVGNVFDSFYGDKIFLGEYAFLTPTDTEPSTAAGEGLFYWDDSENTIKIYDGATWNALNGGGGGDVTKVGTPVDNQVGVWTGDGTIEGTSGLVYDGGDFDITGNAQLTGTMSAQDVNIEGSTSGGVTLSVPAVAGTNTITVPASTGTMALTSDIIDPSGTYLPLAAGAGSPLTGTLFTPDVRVTNLASANQPLVFNDFQGDLLSNPNLRVVNGNQIRIQEDAPVPYYTQHTSYGSIFRSYDGTKTWFIGNRNGYVSTQKDSTVIAIYPKDDFSQDALEFDYEDDRWEIEGQKIQQGEKLYGNQYVKDNVAYATTANIALTGVVSVDGTNTGQGTRVLVKNQTTASENGVYIASSSGAWTRIGEMNSPSEFSGSVVYVLYGSTNSDSYWQCTNTGNVTVETTNITFTEATWVGGTTNWGTPVDTNILPDATQTHNIGAVGNVFQDIYANAFNGSLFGSNVEVNTVSAGQYYVIYPQTSDLDPSGFAAGRVLLFNNSTEDRVKLGIGGTSTVESVAYLSDITDTYLPSENTFVKETVKNATTGNITLSGNQSIDGNTTSNGDRILVRAQTDPIENGIYVANAGAWSRAEDMNANFEVSGSLIYVQFGNTLFNKYYFCTNTGSVGLGSVAVTFAETDLQGGGGGGSIGGSITDNQIAIGATTANDIEGSADLTFDATTGTLGVNANRTGGINKVLDLLIPDMIANDWAQITLGESQTSGDAGEFSFVKGATAPANYFTLGLYNNQFLEMWNDDTFHLLAGETVLEDLNPDLSGYDGMSYTTDLTNPLAFTWSVNNSTAGSPTVIGTVDYNNGTEGTQFRLGDLGNTLENQYNAGMVLKSWSTLVLDAGTESLVQTDFTDADYNDDITEGLRVNILEDKQVTIRQSNVAARTAPYLEVQEESGAVVMSLDESGILNLDKAGADALVNDNVVIGAAYYTGAPQGTVGTRWRMYGTSGGNLSFDTGSSNADYTLATNTNRYTLNETGIPAIATDLIDKAYADANYTAGSGDVTKVGTPVDNQIGVWTGDGTLEGGSNFTLNGDNLLLTDTTPEFSVLSTGVSAAIYRLGNSTGNWHFEAGTDIFRFAETGVGYAFTINEGNGSNIDFSRALSVNGDITLLANKDLILTGATSGTSTITAPAIAGTTTLTLPASTGTLATNMIVETVSSSITLDGFRGADDQTADTASFTVDGAVAGGTYQVIINRATAPTITGATQLPNTQAFIAATKMALTFIVNADSSVSYTYTEL